MGVLSVLTEDIPNEAVSVLRLYHRLLPRVLCGRLKPEVTNYQLLARSRFDDDNTGSADASAAEARYDRLNNEAYVDEVRLSAICDIVFLVVPYDYGLMNDCTQTYGCVRFIVCALASR